MLFLICITFRKDKDFIPVVYRFILSMICHISDNIDDFPFSVKEDLLSLEIFKKMAEVCPFEKTSSNSYEFKMTDEHKLILEIFMKLGNVHAQVSKDGIEPIYTYTEPILQVEKAK
jgi:hypothetical protein